MTETETEQALNPDVYRGEKVLVHHYYGYEKALTFPVERICSGPVDSQGDLPLEVDDANPNTFYAKTWTKAPAAAGPEYVPAYADDDEGWNPNVPDEAKVWVWNDSSVVAGSVNPRGFDVRTVARGEKDSDGEILLVSATEDGVHLGSYGRKWRLPEENARPMVKKGDRVKVLGCLNGAADYYVKALMGKVLTVSRDSRHEGDSPISVHLPDGLKVDGFTTGVISEWALIGQVDPGYVPAPAGADGTVNWGEVIRQWREALHEYACEREWCSEFEETVLRLFGWVEERGADYDVTIQLTKEKWLSDLASNICYQVFDGDREEDNWNLDDERIDIKATITVSISCQGTNGPTEDEVREYLEEQDFEYDEVHIIEYERIQD